jgi:hypothetical protein
MIWNLDPNLDFKFGLGACLFIYLQYDYLMLHLWSTRCFSIKPCQPDAFFYPALVQLDLFGLGPLSNRCFRYPALIQSSTLPKRYKNTYIKVKDALKEYRLTQKISTLYFLAISSTTYRFLGRLSKASSSNLALKALMEIVVLRPTTYRKISCLYHALLREIVSSVSCLC